MTVLYLTKKETFSIHNVVRDRAFGEYLKARKTHDGGEGLTVQDSLLRLANFWSYLGYSCIRNQGRYHFVRSDASWALAGHPRYLAFEDAVSFYNRTVVRDYEKLHRLTTVHLKVELTFPYQAMAQALTSKPDDQPLKLQRCKGALKVHA